MKTMAYLTVLATLLGVNLLTLHVLKEETLLLTKKTKEVKELKVELNQTQLQLAFSLDRNAFIRNHHAVAKDDLKACIYALHKNGLDFYYTR